MVYVSLGRNGNCEIEIMEGGKCGRGGKERRQKPKRLRGRGRKCQLERKCVRDRGAEGWRGCWRGCWKWRKLDLYLESSSHLKNAKLS